MLNGYGMHRMPVRPVYIGETPVYAAWFDAERLTGVKRTLLIAWARRQPDQIET